MKKCNLEKYFELKDLKLLMDICRIIMRKHLQLIKSIKDIVPWEGNHVDSQFPEICIQLTGEPRK